MRPAAPDASHAALATEVHGLSADVHALSAEVHALREEEVGRNAGHEAKLQAIRDELVAIGQLALDDEAASRRLLAAARATPEYEAVFSDPEPLLTVCIPTYTNYRGLVEKAIPSVLAQDYENIEIVVVGDAAPPETGTAIAMLGDRRVRYENLTIRGPYPEDPRRRWLVAGTRPLNRSIDLARGAWITILNDDDALRTDHASKLLAAASASRDEVVYGKFEQHSPGGPSDVIGIFPPESHRFGWQCAIQHCAVARLFQYELAAALFDEPGDWHRARRMIRAGVRFSMIDEIVFDYFPSLLWGGQ